MAMNIPLAVLSTKPHLLLRLLQGSVFAQSPIRRSIPLREEPVMSLEMHLGRRAQPFRPKPLSASLLHLDSPAAQRA